MKKFIITEGERERILNLHKTRSSKQYLIERKVGDFTYSVVPKNGKFRIYVTGGKYTTPIDAETAFGKATNWVDYDTKEAAQEKINSFESDEPELDEFEPVNKGLNPMTPKYMIPGPISRTSQPIKNF